LGAQQTAVNLHIQQMTSSVSLVEALGGGWDSTQLPSQHQLVSSSTTNSAAPNPSSNPQGTPTNP